MGRDGIRTRVAPPPGPLPRSGTRVRVSGRTAADGIAATAIEPDPDGSPASTTDAAADATVRHIAVLLVRPGGAAPEYSRSSAEEWTFSGAGSVDAYWREVSFGPRTVTGDVSGWRTIPTGDRPCDYPRWADDADAAAAADGMDLAAYSSVVYAFPETSTCPWRGAAELGRRRIWVNGNGAADRWLGVVAHELAHNWGAHHAAAAACVDGAGALVPASPRCSHEEYGDPFDMMGWV